MAKKVTAALEQAQGDDPNAPPKPYETEGHLRTLIEAHQIVSDPVKMKAVHKLAGRHEAAVSGIRSLKQLRAVANAKHMQKAGGKSAPLAPMMEATPAQGADGDD